MTNVVGMLSRCIGHRQLLNTACRNASSSSRSKIDSSGSETRLQHIDEHFEATPPEQRNKQSFNTAIELFRHKQKQTRGHVEFINSALKYLEEYGLQKDLDTYKSLLNVFPKGAMIPRNSFQKVFLHYPMQQNCCVKLLDQMEWFGVQPDKEVHDIVANAFGEWNFATKKIKRMLYWMPKLKNSNQYVDRRLLEGRDLSDVELAFQALKMMARDPGTALSYVNIKQCELDEYERWLVSAQSALQQRLLSELKPKSTLYVDGPNRVYVMDRKLEYVWLSADPPSTQCFDNFSSDSQDDEEMNEWRSRWDRGGRVLQTSNIHEQKDETVLGVAVLGRTADESCAAWINHLTENNPCIRHLRVIFRLKRTATDLTVPNPIEYQSAHTVE